jgi:hypothetical protein
MKLEVRPPTYPARPIDGGKLDKAEPLDPVEWRFRPKFNGRRVLCHVPSLRTWTRELVENKWGKFPAFHQLQLLIGLRWPHFEWLDLELLHGKTRIAKRSIIVLDYINPTSTWGNRMSNLTDLFAGHHQLNILNHPNDDRIYLPQLIPVSAGMKSWKILQQANKDLGCRFYEGLVAYNMHGAYPIQLFNPLKETGNWIKYRFIK